MVKIVKQIYNKVSAELLVYTIQCVASELELWALFVTRSAVFEERGNDIHLPLHIHTLTIYFRHAQSSVDKNKE